ncbi:MAG: PQQ-binding-like beta-propeller repeat protein [Thermoleophilaceae bacterium]
MIRALFVALVVVVAVPASATADWPVYGHDLSNTRSAGSDGPSAADVGSMKPAWTFNSSNGDFTGTPVVAGGVLVAGTNLGTIYAVDAVTGKPRWSHDVGNQINGSAAIDTGAPGGPAVYVPVGRLGSPHLLALSLADGAVRWDTTLTKQEGADVFGSPTFWNGVLYIGTSGPNSDEASARGTVSAVDEATGAIRWQTYTVPEGDDGGAVWSTPAIDTAGGRLFVGTGNAYHEPAADTTDSIMALDAGSGAVLGHYQVESNDVWQMDMPLAGPDHDFGASANLISGLDGHALVGEGNKDGTYYAFDRATLQPAWKTTIGPGGPFGGILASTAYDGTRVYGTDSLNGHIWSLNRDGSSQWTSDDGGTIVFSPAAVSNGVLYTANPNGFLIARDSANGSVLGRFSLNAPTLGGISVVGRAVYVSVGTGPPPQPLPQVDESSFDGSGSIVAFGDTSQSGAAPASTKQSGKRPKKPHSAIRLSVAPHAVQAGQTVTFRFRARRGARALRGVAVRLAGRKVHTNARGRAAMRVRLPKPGTYAVEAWRHGLGRTTAVVEAREPRADHGQEPAAGKKRAADFNGSCEFTGTVTFTPPLTNSPQDVNQKVQAKGTCTGTLTDRAGQAHDLNGAPVVYQSVADAKGVSCGSGLNAGAGELDFEDATIGFKFQETRVGPFPLLQYTGQASGSAMGTAMPAQDQDPTAALQCAGDGLKQFSLSGRLQTTPDISG